MIAVALFAFWQAALHMMAYEDCDGDHKNTLLCSREQNALHTSIRQRRKRSREASFLVSIDAACAVLTFDVPPTQAPAHAGLSFRA